jgi:hypothetical protein
MRFRKSLISDFAYDNIGATERGRLTSRLGKMPNIRFVSVAPAIFQHIEEKE